MNRLIMDVFCVSSGLVSVSVVSVDSSLGTGI